MNIKDFAEKFIKAEDEIWNTGNADLLEKLEDPNVQYHMPQPNPDVKGFPEHKQQILGMRTNFSEIKQEWKYLAGEGSVFALSYKAHYTSNGKMPGLPSGRVMNTDAVFIFQLKKGKIIEA